MIKLSKEDKFFTIKESAIDIEKVQALDSLKELDKKVKDKKRKELYHYLDRQEEVYKEKKVKILIDFDEDVSCVK